MICASCTHPILPDEVRADVPVHARCADFRPAARPLAGAIQDSAWASAQVRALLSNLDAAALVVPSR